MSFGSFHNDSDYNDNDKDLADINMIPLIDVMLVLLITFMIAAPLSIRGIDVKLPSIKAKGKTIENEKIILSINKHGKFFIDKTEISPEKLENKLNKIFTPRVNKRLFIRADKRARHGKVMNAMSLAKLAGVKKLSMLTTYRHSKL